MTLQTRLHRVTQSLSPLQRAILVIQVAREGRDPDPELRRIDDEVQRRAFNRYMGLLWVANYHLGASVSITGCRVEVAEQDAAYFEMLSEAAALIEEHHGLEHAMPVRNWRRKDLTTAPEMLRGMALERRDDAIALIELLWRETLGVEAVWTELAEDFGGEDIIMPDVRQRHADTQQRLKVAAKKVGLRRLPAEAGPDLMQAYQDSVADSFHHLGYSEA